MCISYFFLFLYCIISVIINKHENCNLQRRNKHEQSYIEPPLHANWGGHPILPELREKNYQYNIPVHIGKNYWLGAGVVGNPCRVLRPINERDKEYYFKDRKIEL